MLDGHQGASGRTVAAYFSMASRVWGSSHERGRWTTRFSISISPTGGRDSSNDRIRSSSADLGRLRGSKRTCRLRMPGVQSRIPGRASASNRSSRTWTRSLSSRSRTMGPNSTRIASSPSCRTQRSGTSGRPAARCRTISGDRRCQSFRKARGSDVQAVSCASAEANARSAPSCASCASRASDQESGENRTVSPAESCPSFQSSESARVTGQAKPPNEGPSGPKITGVSPVKSTVPTT